MIIFFFKFTVRAFLKVGGVYRKFLSDAEVDLCMLYNGLIRTKLFKTTHLNCRMENLSLGCPVTGNRYAIDVKLAYEDYPEIIPSGQWRFDSSVSTVDNDGQRVLLLTSQQYFEVAYNSTQIF